jgi:hypothetical protein
MPHGIVVKLPDQMSFVEAALLELASVGRPGQPNDLDGTVIFLAFDASAFVTG